MEKLPRLEPAPLSSLQARRICIVKTSSLGDVVQTLPVLDAVRRRFPRAEISWVVNKSYAPLLRPIPLIDQVIEFDRDCHWRDFGAAGRFAREFVGTLRRNRFDLVIDLQGLLRSGLMTWLTGAKRRVGLASAREGAWLFYTEVVDDRGAGPGGAVDRYWRVAELLGMGRFPKRFPLNLSPAERQWATDRLAGLARPILAISPGARWETKRWPAQRFAEVANGVLGPTGGSVVLLGAPGEEPLAAEVARGLEVPYVDLAGVTTLRRLAAALASCDALFANDSGPMHFAAALDVPTVSMFTCTDPRRAAPFGAGHQVVQTTVSCRASYLKRCDRLDCMKELTTQRVEPVLATAIERFVSASNPPNILLRPAAGDQRAA